jgi:hypothetical protein
MIEACRGARRGDRRRGRVKDGGSDMDQLTLDRQLVNQTCDHCGRVFHVIRGHAYDNPTQAPAHVVGIYMVGLHTCNGPKLAHLAIAVRAPEPAAESRHAVALTAWASETDYEMAVVDGEASPWRGEAYLGRLMDREEALGSDAIRLVFHVADHVVADNPEVYQYLVGEADA